MERILRPGLDAEEQALNGKPFKIVNCVQLQQLFLRRALDAGCGI
ncbi:MAG: hypothetical protein ABIJ10_01875 [Candidatus Micrarchaeota archaeon]